MDAATNPALTTFHAALERYRVNTTIARIARRTGNATMVGKAAARAGVALREMRRAAAEVNGGAS